MELFVKDAGHSAAPCIDGDAIEVVLNRVGHFRVLCQFRRWGAGSGLFQPIDPIAQCRHMFREKADAPVALAHAHRLGNYWLTAGRLTSSVPESRSTSTNASRA